MNRKSLSLAPATLLFGGALLSSPAVLATPACYEQAQKSFEAHSISEAEIIPSGAYIALDDEQRARLPDGQIISAVDGSHCEASTMIAGGMRVETTKLSVPFGRLYETVSAARADKDAARLQRIADTARAAPKNLEALFALYQLPPPAHLGGWARFRKLTQLYRVEIEPTRWIDLGMPSMYQAMGGKVVEDCAPHDVPDKLTDRSDLADLAHQLDLKIGIDEQIEGQVHTVRFTHCDQEGATG